MVKINKFEYELLTHKWSGPAGAAHNVCWEFCVENRLMTKDAVITDKGKAAIKDYELNLAL